MAHDKGTVYLLDGSSYIHRAYHAIRNLSNSEGFPTNAAFGFTKMLLKLLSDKSPEYLAVVFDAKGPTFRHEIYGAYKANRPPMPEALSVQVPVIKSIVKNLNLKMIEKEGYEADDIIGTLARVWEEKGFRVVMVTGDKDFRQLITPNVSMWDTMKDRVTDYHSIKEVYGLEPERFIDVMSLSGDTSDNIPGVPGVGEKTALTLIREFGSLEEALKRANQVKGKKLKENLKAHEEDALMSKKLVTIDRFVPLDEEAEPLDKGEPDKEGLAEIFREMEFRGLWDQFATRDESLEKTYELRVTETELRDLAGEIAGRGRVSLDTETTSEDPLAASLVGISFSWEEGQAYYVPLAHRYPGAPAQLGPARGLDILRGVLEDGEILKIGQNIKYDAIVLKRHGVTLRGIHFDTMIASYVINPGLRQHNLDYLAQHYLNHKMITYGEVVGSGKGKADFSQVDVEAAGTYSCEDADMTLKLWRLLEKKLGSDQNEPLFYELEMKLLPVLMEMEMSGVKIDAGHFQEMSARFSDQMEEIAAEIYDEAGMVFNINSPQQLGEVLFEKLQLPVQKKTAKTKRYSTDVKVLERLCAYPHKMPKRVLRYRSLAKLKSTYLDALVKMVNRDTGRIHTSFNQTVTATGRLSSSNPNLQNIPIKGEEGRQIRRGFVAEKGHFFVSADYSQVELRVFAHYSEDPAFLDAFREEQDIHSRTAAEILGVDQRAVDADQRRIAKAINFGIIYGMGPVRLSEELGIDRKTAKAYLDTYYERYRGVVEYRERMIESAREKGYVTTLFNRRRYLPGINHSKQRIRSEAERMAVNTPIQGTAADLIKKAMIRLHRRLQDEGFGGRMLLQVHDELLFEVPEGERDAIVPLIREEMEGVYPLKAPLKVEIHVGRNWDEAH
jgi:DNA polymerase-1